MDHTNINLKRQSVAPAPFCAGDEWGVCARVSATITCAHVFVCVHASTVCGRAFVQYHNMALAVSTCPSPEMDRDN